MATQEQVVQILQQLKAQGEDMGALKARLGSLPEEKQHAFFDHLAGQMQPAAAEAPPPALSQMNFTPDKDIPSALETAFRVTRNLALGRMGEQAVEAVSRGFQTGFSRMTANPGEQQPTLTEAATPDIKRREAGEAANPKAALIGELAGPAVQAAATAPAANLAGKAAAAIAKPALETVADLLGSHANRISVGLAKISKNVAKRLGPEGLDELGQLMRDKGVTSTPRTLANLSDKVESLRGMTGEELGAAYKEVSSKAVSLSKDDLSQMVQNAAQQAAARTGTTVAQDELEAMAKELDNYLEPQIKAKTMDPNALTVSDRWKIAKSIEKGSRRWLASDPNKANIANQVADALRDINQFSVKQVAPELADHIAEMGHQYSLLKAADDGLYGQLVDVGRNAPGPGIVRSMLHATITSTPAQTAALKGAGATQAGLDYTAKLLSNSKELGKYYPVLTRALRSGGLSAVMTRHAHLMMDDPNYREIVDGLEIR